MAMPFRMRAMWTTTAVMTSSLVRHGLAPHGTVRLFHPFLDVDGYTVSAVGGGSIQLDLDFPLNAAGFDYKTLITMSGTGGMLLGIRIPLAEDVLVHHTFKGNYPFASCSNLQGSLDASGDATASISIAPSELSTSLIGRTFHIAVVSSLNRAMAADYSSVAIPIEITP